MKKLVQHLNNGKIELLDCPKPSLGSKDIMTETNCSLISSGTERMLLDFGRSSFIQKAIKEKERINDVINKIKTDGLFSTIEAVNYKLNNPIPLGYSNVGRIIQLGSNVKGYHIGDRIVSNSSHSEITLTRKNLCSLIPKNVSDETASFTVIGSIALHGIRLANVNIGDRVAVVGTGLIGLLTIQILKANGCEVLAFDINQDRLNLAEKFGAHIFNLSGESSPEDFVNNYTNKFGVDKTIITASTKSNHPIKLSSKITRKRGKIILVGVADIHFDRSDLYEKEITFQVSCSYGPGRYDEAYEKEGIDYPYSYVRWTEKRNFDSVLKLMSDKKIVTDDLLSKKYDFFNSSDAYNSLLDNNNIISILLEYPKEKNKTLDTLQLEDKSYNNEKPIVSVVGSGNYATRTIIPNLKKLNVQLDTIISKEGLSGTLAAKKFGFAKSSSNLDDCLNISDSNTFFITTRHNLHAEMIIKCLKQNKNIFCEKPLALSLDDLELIKKSYHQYSSSKLMIGFNRRFSPLSIKAKSLLSNCQSPKSFIFTFNSGYVPDEHWVNDINIGGGRILGEACHHIDLMRFLCGHKITNIHSKFLKNKTMDTAVLSLEFDDGSIGSINYFSNGNNGHSKEDIKIFCEQKILHIDNFKILKGYGWSNFKNLKLFYQDKGQLKCLSDFINSIEEGTISPISLDEILEVNEFAIHATKNL